MEVRDLVGKAVVQIVDLDHVVKVELQLDVHHD